MEKQSEFKVEKVPENIKLSKQGRNQINYPFGQMKVGEMFRVDTDRANATRASAYNYVKFKNNNFKFSLRKILGTNKSAFIRIK